MTLSTFICKISHPIPARLRFTYELHVTVQFFECAKIAAKPKQKSTMSRACLLLISRLTNVLLHKLRISEIFRFMSD